MLCTMTKRWYLCCYKYWHRNLNVYPNVYSRKISFLLEKIQTIQFHHKKTNEHSKTGILMKLMKKSGNYCKVAYGLGTKLKNFMCERSH